MVVKLLDTGSKAEKPRGRPGPSLWRALAWIRMEMAGRLEKL